MSDQVKVLVTGGGGFIGHHLTKYMINRGYWVRGVDIKEPHTRLREVLKWEPQISLEDGLARTYAWIEGELKKSSIPATATV